MSSAENVPLVNPTTVAASLAHRADGAVETCCDCPLIRTQRLRLDVKALTSYKCLSRSKLTMAALWSSEYQPGSHVSLLLCFQCPPPLCVSVCVHIYEDAGVLLKKSMAMTSQITKYHTRHSKYPFGE